MIQFEDYLEELLFKSEGCPEGAEIPESVFDELEAMKDDISSNDGG